jgi:asparagine synthase (glutamine-hydrolysing)
MCGLTGFLELSPSMRPDEQSAVCRRMADTLLHRGPDDAGVWVDSAAGIALGHRRLSVVDLSPLGHQPMVSESGRYVVAYNGEIYNFEELRAELTGHRFRGRSDTEVALAAVEQWGVPRALERLNGMFAIALWDTHERALWLARDRFGEKPLYYGMVGRTLVFGSELKALRAFPGFAPEIDRGAVAAYMRYAYVPTPGTIFSGVRKLPAATWLRIASRADVDVAPTSYFSLEDVARENTHARFRGTDEEAVTELDALLRRTVKQRMLADVPLGAFLSGGIDSSVVVAMMQAAGGARARTFTIGFHEPAFDEAESARAVASHLGTDHTELYVTASEAQAVIPDLPRLYDEPFADSSQIPTFLVSRMARRHVTVALSGDGGDELFGGYNRYTWADTIWRRIARVPPGARSLLARAIRHVRPSTVDALAAILDPHLPARLRLRMAGDKLQKLAAVLPAASADDLFVGLTSTWDPATVVPAPEPRRRLVQDRTPRLDDFAERMMCADALGYLPDDILVKVDRAAMAVSLETRVPFLDPEVASFAWSLPKTMRIRDGKGKWILREVLARYVPRTLFERPKMGFGVPIDSWLRGPLRDWAETLLSATRLRDGGYLIAEPIRDKWAEHLSGRRNWQHQMWSVLMFQAWRESWAEGRSASPVITAPAMSGMPAPAVECHPRS